MNIRIITHLMPWEIDYALLMFTQLKKSSYYIPEGVNIEVETVLNLSSYIINWEESKISKEYFIKKYNNLSKLLTNYKTNFRVFDEDKLYGHLDFQKEHKSSHIDYYFSICPDVYFSEYSLMYMIECLKQIEDEYFILTCQHRKLTDSSWDPTTDPDYLNISYKESNQLDIFDIRHKTKNQESNVYLTKVDSPKFAGWFDVFSKKFYEDLTPVHDDWSGYGPWDWYSMFLLSAVKDKINFNQYLLRGQTVGDYWIGPLEEVNGFSGYYKDFIKLNDIPNQRTNFEANMLDYVNKGIGMLKEKGII
jgi:hypothetical protein